MVQGLLDDLEISIHAPRGGSDTCLKSSLNRIHDFNPRSPWGERLNLSILMFWLVLFQSTLPVGGATVASFRTSRNSAISIHAPRGGSDMGFQFNRVHNSNFNPRSPWGERPGAHTVYAGHYRFQSTLPVGGATTRGRVNHNKHLDFNPRSPWGERLFKACP